MSRLESELTTHVVSIDGGPCSGKSSVMRYLQQMELADNVLFIPEIATGIDAELRQQGSSLADIAGADRPAYLGIQERIIRGYMTQIDGARADMQDSGGVIITDRAPAGIKAYVAADEWPGVLQAADTTEQEVLHDYADSVVYLASLAITNPAKYEQERASNEARSEDIEAARELHYQSLACWQGHQSLIEIDGDDIVVKQARVGAYIGWLLQTGFGDTAA